MKTIDLKIPRKPLSKKAFSSIDSFMNVPLYRLKEHNLHEEILKEQEMHYDEGKLEFILKHPHRCFSLVRWVWLFPQYICLNCKSLSESAVPTVGKLVYELKPEFMNYVGKIPDYYFSRKAHLHDKPQTQLFESKETFVETVPCCRICVLRDQ